MASAKETVMGLQAAMGNDDWKAARGFLADHHFRFDGPFDSFTTAEEYLAAIQKLHGMVERVDPHHLFVDGDDVCVLYDLVTNSPAGTAFICEWHHVTNGKIDKIRVVFDARPFAPMMGK